MAMKEDQEDGTNPFSFSNFVLKKEDSNDSSKTLVKNHETVNDNPYTFQNFNKKPVDEPPSKPKNKKLLIVDDDVDNVGDDIFADIVPPKNKKKSKGRKKEISKSFSNECSNFEASNNPAESSSEDTNFVSNKNENVDELSDNDDDENDENLSSSPQEDSYILPDPDNDLLEQLHLLKLENTDLRNDIERLKKQYKEHSGNSDKKVKNLQTELEKTRKKEAEDTQALEDVVRMVEENLQKTTARALKAETTVTKLREELKILKESQISIPEYEKLQRDHHFLLNTIQDKSRNAAQLIRNAADKTEPHIRQLQSGLQSLRFLAEQFDGIGTIVEIPQDNKPNS